MTHGPVVVSFVGPSGVGKTTLLERLIPAVQARGLTVGTAKHASHGHDVDRAGSDSWRHRRAGAEAVLLAGAGGVVLFLDEPDTEVDDPRSTHHSPTSTTATTAWLGELIDRHLHHLDVVLVEGFAPVHDLLVAVERHDVPPKRSSSSTPWAVVTDRPHGAGGGELGFDDIDELADRIVAHARSVGTKVPGDPPPNR